MADPVSAKIPESTLPIELYELVDRGLEHQDGCPRMLHACIFNSCQMYHDEVLLSVIDSDFVSQASLALARIKKCAIVG